MNKKIRNNWILYGVGMSIIALAVGWNDPQQGWYIIGAAMVVASVWSGFTS